MLLLLVFNLLLNFLTREATTGITLPFGLTLNAFQLLPIQIIGQIILGIVLGLVTAKILVLLLTKQNWTQNKVQDTLVTASFVLALVVIAEKFPFFSRLFSSNDRRIFLN